MIIDTEELDEWIQRWYTAISDEEFAALKRVFESFDYPYEDFKARLELIGYWREDMKMLQPDTNKSIDLF